MLRLSSAVLDSPSAPLSLICTKVEETTEGLAAVSFTHLTLTQTSYITRHPCQSWKLTLEQHCRLSCRLHAHFISSSGMHIKWPFLCSGSKSRFHFVLSYHVLSHSQFLMTLAIPVLSACPLSLFRISCSPIWSQAINVAMVTLNFWSF